MEKPAVELLIHNKEEKSGNVFSSTTNDRNETNRKVLMQLQSIFGHLQEGKVQFHIPKGFWRDFRCSIINLVTYQAGSDFIWHLFILSHIPFSNLCEGLPALQVTLVNLHFISKTEYCYI